MIDLVICLLIAIVLAAAFYGVVRAVLSLELMVGLRSFANVINALIVLLLVLLVISYCLGGIWSRHPVP